MTWGFRIVAEDNSITPRKFNSSPLKINIPNRKVVFQPPFFRAMLNFGQFLGFPSANWWVYGNVLMFCRNPPMFFGCLMEASLNQQDLTTNPVKTIPFATVKCGPKIFLSDEFCAILALNVFWIPSSGSRVVGSRSIKFIQVSLWQYITPLLHLYDIHFPCWTNYNDQTARGHLKWWFSKGISPPNSLNCMWPLESPLNGISPTNWKCDL